MLGDKGHGKRQQIELGEAGWECRAGLLEVKAALPRTGVWAETRRRQAAGEVDSCRNRSERALGCEMR